MKINGTKVYKAFYIEVSILLLLVIILLLVIDTAARHPVGYLVVPIPSLSAEHRETQ